MEIAKVLIVRICNFREFCVCVISRGGNFPGLGERDLIGRNLSQFRLEGKTI